MSTISTILSTLRSAVWAIDVRDEIANAIEQCYKDVNSPSLVTDGIEEVIGDMVDNGRISGAIVEDLGLITEGTSNLFDFTTVTAGRLNTSTGEVGEASGYWTSDFILVENGKTYYFANTDRRVAYNSSKAYSANISGTTWTASADGYIRVSVTSANRKTAKINEGSAKDYRPGRSPIDFNLRDDVYRKAEVDAALAAVTIATDPELETAGAAADAKATGDAISVLNESLDNTTELVDSVVEDKYIFSGNVIDTSMGSLVSGVPNDIYFQMPKGTYYPNPFTLGSPRTGLWYLYPQDKNGNNIPMTNKNGDTVSNITFGSTVIIVITVADALTVTTKSYSSMDKYISDSQPTIGIFTLESKPYRWKLGGKSFSDLNQGFTQGFTSDTYVAYAEPTKVPNYADSLKGFIDDSIDAGVGSIYVDTYNILDLSTLNWSAYESGASYLTSYSDEYISISAGDNLMSNVDKITYYWYDETHTSIGTYGAPTSFSVVTVPNNAVYMRVSINRNFVPEDRKIYVYKSENTRTPADDRRSYIRNKEIDPSYLTNKKTFNYATPDSINSQLFKTVQWSAMRVVNAARNAFRIGTFNIHVAKGNRHWGELKQELLDHQIEICGFQEVSNSQTRILQSYMSGWQFPYGSTEVFNGSYVTQAILSHYEIESTVRYTYVNDNEGRTFVKSVIKLPQYKHHPHELTLSVYSTHLSLNAANRLSEVSELLAQIANDTSDFKVVCMDSNAFKTEADAQGKRPTWEAMIAGGFTPIHYGEYNTVTSTEATNSIDQIFMSENISCIEYFIVDSNDYPVAALSDSPISDHCMVYADLQFDFDTVLEQYPWDT